jgi:hypothetical protein
MRFDASYDVTTKVVSTFLCLGVLVLAAALAHRAPAAALAIALPWF